LRGSPSIFDACQIGVVLRTVVFVEVVVAIATLFVASTPGEWLVQAATVTGGALPATLLWLVSACGLKKPLQRLPKQWQYTAGAVLGAVSALYGCGLLRLTGVLSTAPWLASALAGTLFSALVMAAMVLRARGQTPAAMTARIEELQSRIRPHFLFNTLNSALTLVRLDPARAEGVLEDLAELFRVAISDSVESVSLADEIELAQRYLAIEQIRFGDRLRVTWELDADASVARVPPLLLQPLVENAVRHGIEPADEGGWIRVRTRVKLGRALIAISNSVPAASAAARPGNGMALRNVRERLRLMHDVAGQFGTRLEHDAYRVQIMVPLPS
jgi:two-component system sensor histidine kinase AlgZ